jgi:predicted nucleic acid-binding protein
MPILDLLEILELVCADRVTALTLICLCNAKSGQVDTAKMFSQRTLQLITSNSKIFSAKKYSSLISEAISVAGKVSSHTELNAYQGLRKHFTPP